MSDTALLALGSPLVALTRGATALLGDWLDSGACNVALAHRTLEYVSIFVLKVLEHVMKNVSAEGHVINGVVQQHFLVRAFTTDEIVNWNPHLLIKIKRFHCPLLCD